MPWQGMINLVLTPFTLRKMYVISRPENVRTVLETVFSKQYREKYSMCFVKRFYKVSFDESQSAFLCMMT